MFKVIKVDEENVYIASTEGGKTLKLNKSKLDWEVKVWDYVEFYDAGNEIIVTKIPTEEALIILQKEQAQKSTQTVQQTTTHQPQTTQDSSKTIGFLCGLFLGLIGLVVGLAMYSDKPQQKSNFMSGWGTAFVISIVAGVIIGFIYYSIMLGMIGNLY